MLTVIMIGISLSMDAFSLSLAYGTLNLNKKIIYIQSIIVGIYHFFMPSIGNFLGSKLLCILPIKMDIIVFLVLFIIGIQMIIETFKKQKIRKISKYEMIIFGFAVSIDSLSLGVGLRTIYSNILISITVFMITSFIFTYIGLTIGKKVNEIVGKLSTIIGGIILVIIGLFYLI